MLGHNDTELLDPTLGAAMRAADQTALAHGRQLTSEHRFDWRDIKHDWEVLRLVTELGGRRVLACLWRDLGAAAACANRNCMLPSNRSNNTRSPPSSCVVNTASS